MKRKEARLNSNRKRTSVKDQHGGKDRPVKVLNQGDGFNTSLPSVSSAAKNEGSSTLGLDQCTFSPRICQTGLKDRRKGTVFILYSFKAKKGKSAHVGERWRILTAVHLNPQSQLYLVLVQKELKKKLFERLYKDHEKRLEKLGNSKTKLPVGCTFSPM